MEKGLRKAYMDKTYIHQHYHRNDELIWDPNDEQDVIHSKAKGWQYCFVCAIQGPNHRDINDLLGLAPNLVWAFCLQQKKDTLQTTIKSSTDKTLLHGGAISSCQS